TLPTYPLSLHDALPIFPKTGSSDDAFMLKDGHEHSPAESPPQEHAPAHMRADDHARSHKDEIPVKEDRAAHPVLAQNSYVQPLRSEEHTSELQSRSDLV